MHINFYRNNIDNSVMLPIYAYEIKAKTKNSESENLDVLGEAILGLLEVGKTIDVNWIINMLGIPFKYKKLVDYEINELLDSGNIVINDNEIIIEINNVSERNVEVFYVIYDRVNKILLDCILPENEFKGKYLRRNDDELVGKQNCIIKNEDRFPPDRYKICYLIQQLIRKSNETINHSEDSYYEEIDEFVRPFYQIDLDTVENIDKPIEADFLFKVTVDKNNDIQYESPFTKDNYSAYIEKNIKNRVNHEELKKLIQDFDFMDLEDCKKRSQAYINDYKKLDSNKLRVEHIEKIAYFKEVVSLEKNIYKNISITISNFDKVIKSILKEIVERFGESKMEKRNIRVSNFNNLEKINDVKIINSFINDNIKRISKDYRVIKNIGETSIVSYLKAIYISKYFTQQKYDQDVFDLFSENNRLNLFLSEVWMYRNSTGHNVERGRFYDSAYDLDIMEKERLQEVMSQLNEELIYFIKEVKKI